jgi:hypothetical protein
MFTMGRTPLSSSMHVIDDPPASSRQIKSLPAKPRQSKSTSANLVQPSVSRYLVQPAARPWFGQPKKMGPQDDAQPSRLAQGRYGDDEDFHELHEDFDELTEDFGESDDEVSDFNI